VSLESLLRLLLSGSLTRFRASPLLNDFDPVAIQLPVNDVLHHSRCYLSRYACIDQTSHTARLHYFCPYSRAPRPTNAETGPHLSSQPKATTTHVRYLSPAPTSYPRTTLVPLCLPYHLGYTARRYQPHVPPFTTSDRTVLYDGCCPAVPPMGQWDVCRRDGGAGRAFAERGTERSWHSVGMECRGRRAGQGAEIRGHVAKANRREVSCYCIGSGALKLVSITEVRD
jgi:hypothetical protein